MKVTLIIFFQIILLWVSTGGSDRPLENRSCRLQTILPFTISLEDVDADSLEASGLDTAMAEAFLSILPNNVGYSHMAAALMAMEHFNDRNHSVVPELGQEQFALSNCDFVFDMNHSRFFDSRTVSHKAASLLIQDILTNGPPCAIAGPYNDIPAPDLSALATALQVPIMPHRSLSFRLASSFYFPMSTQVFPFTPAIADALALFLQKEGRTSYIATIYPFLDTAIEYQETISIAMNGFNMRWAGFQYFPATAGSEFGTENVDRVGDSLLKIKNLGYRTIVVAVEYMIIEIPELANAAEQYQMNRGDHVWIFVGAMELWQIRYVFTELSIINPNITALLQGSVVVAPIEKYQAFPESDPFLASWKSQDDSFVQRVNRYFPIARGSYGFYQGKDDYFQKFTPEAGAAYLYDAIISIGMGACLAPSTVTNENDHSQEEGFGVAHVEGIRKVQFEGATGTILFNDGVSNGFFNGVRSRSTSMIGIINLFPPVATQEEQGHKTSSSSQRRWREDYVLTEYTVGTSGEWKQIRPFVYADGRTIAPELLRDIPEQNYISTGVRALCFLLMSFSLTLCLVSAVWVVVRKEHRIVRASQPYFLFLLCLGSSISSLSLLGINFDESNGLNTNQLDHACMSLPWLASIGHVITYGALFSKLWRVNKVLQFRRTKIQINQVAWPPSLLMLLVILILSIWTSMDSLRWERVEIDDLTGESIGTCDCDYFRVFTFVLAAVLLIPSILTGIMAYKTKDVDDSYSESKWIFVLIMIQIQVMIVSIPVVILLRRENTDVFHVGFSLFLWSFPMSTMVFIIIPKMVSTFRSIHGMNDDQPTRGRHQGVRVTGIPSSASHPVT